MPPIQRTQTHAVKYLRENGLIDQFETVNYASVSTYVNSDAPAGHRRGLRREWNLKQPRRWQIETPEDLKPKQVERVSGGQNFMDWDSDDDDAVKLSSLLNTKSKTVAVYRPTTGKTVDAPVLPFPALIRLGRQSVKRKRITKYFGQPIVTSLGDHYLEFTAPRGNDIVTYPLSKQEDGSYRRQTRTGGVSAWLPMGRDLEGELSDGEDAPKRKRQRITGPFQGEFAVKTENEAEAVGAIACDFMKGSGASGYVRDLMNAPDGSKPKAWFSGSNLIYKPAGGGGRSLATKKTAETKRRKEKEKEKESRTDTAIPTTIGRKTVHNVDGDGMNCLIRAILHAALGSIDESTVGILRQELVTRGVTHANRMIDLAQTAGSILVSYMVLQGILSGSQGITVHVPDGYGGITPINVLEGDNRIELWLSDDHFRALR